MTSWSQGTRASLLLITLAVLTLATTVEAAWYTPAGWQYRKKLTLNGALVQGTQTDFPVLVALNDPDSHLKANAQASGNDILFTAADGTTKLAHEIETYDSTTGSLVAWVKVPTLTNGTNTVVYMYYGNATAGNQQDLTGGVWDANYVAVWHLKETGSGAVGEYRDSTLYANNGRGGGGAGAAVPARVAGQIGFGQSLDGTNDYIDAGTPASLNITGPITLEAWVQLRILNPGGTGAPIVGKGGNPQYNLYQDWDLNDRITFTVTTPAQDYAQTPGSLSLNTWYHAVGTYNGAQSVLYINGAQIHSVAVGAPITAEPALRTFMGKRDASPSFFNGPLDEVRISKVARSASWTQTTYNNQANQGVGAGKFIQNATLEGASARLKLVQSGSVQILGAATQATATLNPPVDMTKSFLVFGVSENENRSDYGQVTGQITATNQVTFERVAASGAPITVQWYVAEFASGVSVQRGITDISNGTPNCGASCLDVTLPNPVNTARSFPIFSQRNSALNFGADDFVRGKLTSSTNLNLLIPDTDATGFLAWQIVEYDAASVQTGDVAFAYTETSKTVSLPTPAVPSRSWLLYTYACGAVPADCADVANIGNKLLRGVMTNATTLTFDRSNAGAAAGDVINLTWYLVSFSDTTYVQHGNQGFAAADTSKDVTLSRSVSPAASIATAGGYTRGGKSPYAGGDFPGVGWFTLQLDKPKNLRISRGAALATADVEWSVVTFPRYEIYGAASLGALGSTGCPAGTYRSATNLIPNGAFTTSGGGAAVQPQAASQFTVDPRQTAPAWGWAGDNTRPLDTQFSMTSGVWCYSSTGPSLACIGTDVSRQGAFPGDPGFNIQPTACGLAANPNTPGYNADYPGCWVYGNGNDYATDYKIWETRGTVGLTAGKTYTFVVYASDVVKPGQALTPPTLSVRKGPNPCTTNAPTIAAMCGTAPPAALHPSAFAVPREYVDTSEGFNPGEIWTRYQVTFAATATESAYFSIWDPAQTTSGVDVALAQVGLYSCETTTEVKLTSFTAAPGNASATLEWRTGSELDNLGFHLDRSTSEAGPWTRITSSLIPGLGSSPVGASYSYLDAGLVNGTRYCYRLEDIDTKSVSTFHGPVCTVPAPPPPGEDGPGGGGGDGKEGGESGSVGGSGKEGPPIGSTRPCPAWLLSIHSVSGSSPLACTPHGDPEAVSLEVLSRTFRSAELELRTGGFWTVEEADGTVRAYVRGFDTPSEAKALALPLRRTLVEAVVGRKVRLVSAEAFAPQRFSGLRPAAVGVADLQVSRDGTVRPVRRAMEAVGVSRGMTPEGLARLGGTVFQGEKKSAVVELTPLRYDARRGELELSGRVRVVVSFEGMESGETGKGSRGRLQRREKRALAEVLAQLHTTRRGLHGVRFEEVFPGRRRGLETSLLRLQREGEAVAFHVEPEASVFGPGSVFYFHAERVSKSTDFTREVAFELVRSREGEAMEVIAGAPEASPLVTTSVGSASFEVNRLYQSGLLEATDVWQWEAMTSGASRTKVFTLAGVDTASVGNGRVVVELQGGSVSGTVVDHHVALTVNGTYVGETRFSGKVPHRMELEVLGGVLREGANEVQVLNVGDTGVSSLVFLDRFGVDYPQVMQGRGGAFEGEFGVGGTAEVGSLAGPAAILDVTAVETGGAAKWVVGSGWNGTSVRFRAEAGHRYQVVAGEGLLSPRVVRPEGSTLKGAENQADYLLIAPASFLAAAEPLLLRRAGEGLVVKAVSLEEIGTVFGHGRASGEAIRSFVSYAYHSWTKPSPRYVVLLGDATYDPQHFVSGSWVSPLPALWGKTSYMWTALDPVLGAVNGEDEVPDVAVGRIPATTVEQAQSLIGKILSWEDRGRYLSGKVGFVADNPDLAGDFEWDVEDIRASLVSGRETEVMKVRELGAETRGAIQAAFDGGLGLMSYVGHGSSAMWASENVWNSWDAETLLSQSEQPVLLTMNCLNGYFVASGFESLSESLLKMEGRGAVAALSPSGLSVDGPAHEYHRELVRELVSGQHERLGDAVLAAQGAYAQTGLMPELLSVYTLFGDPAMKIR